MKKIKVFFNGKKMHEIYPYATRWQVVKYKFIVFVRKLIIVSFYIGVVVGSYELGFHTAGVQTYASEIIKEVPAKAPVLDRIAICESSGMHTRNGQVLTVPNTNGSVDIGLFQINLKVWSKKATELGYDLSLEKDNRAFAEWLYANFGTVPWDSSRKCWNK